MIRVGRIGKDKKNTLYFSNWSLGPRPECIRIWGEFKEPPDIMTSLLEKACRVTP